MKIDNDNRLRLMARFAPGMDFGIAPAPIPAARLRGEAPFDNGEPKWVTWSGGGSFVIPRGAHHVEQAWEFIKWMISPEAAVIANEAQLQYFRTLGRDYMTGMPAYIPAARALFPRFASPKARWREAQDFCMSMMQVSKFRPASPVGQRLWDEQQRAQDVCIYHKKTPAAALREGQAAVQRELDKVLGREKFAVLDWRGPIALIAAAFLGMFVAVGLLARRSGPVGRLMRSEAIAGYLFASPWIIGFLVFTIGPILVSVVLSFCDYDVLHPARYVGWLNYRNLLGEDRAYLVKALSNAAYLAGIGIPLGITTGLSIAMLLNTRVMGMSWYRTLYYLPAVVPTVASAVLWLWMLNPYDYGLVNAGWRVTLTSWFGITPPTWLGSETWAKPALILMGLWGAGSGMIIWLAGLQGVPQHLYEAAEIDGAGAWRKFLHVTLPMLSPTIFFVTIMGSIHALQTFETVYVLTNGVGGPVDATMVPVLYLFNNAFRFFKMGYASALAWLLFWIIMFFTLLQLKLAPRWVHYEGK